VVKVRASNGQLKFARVLLDPASEVTLISEKFVKKLRIPSLKSDRVAIVGVTPGSMPITRSCDLKMESRLSNFTLPITGDIVSSSSLSYCIKYDSITNIREKFYNFEFAESQLSHDDIDILLGVEYTEQCYLDDEQYFCKGLTFRNTHFGWVISG